MLGWVGWEDWVGAGWDEMGWDVMGWYEMDGM